MIKITANYVKCNYFCDDDGIDNVTFRVWKVFNFSSRHTAGIASDHIIYHILVWIYHCFAVCNIFHNVVYNNETRYISAYKLTDIWFSISVLRLPIFLTDSMKSFL